MSHLNGHRCYKRGFSENYKNELKPLLQQFIALVGHQHIFKLPGIELCHQSKKHSIPMA